VTSAFAFAGILSAAGVDIFLVLIVGHLLEREARSAGKVGGRRLDGD
jgi:hypothetical protein